MPANKNAMTRYKILDDLLSNRYHDYSLDDIEPLETKFTCDPGFDAAAFFDECFGVVVADGTKPVRIVLRAFGMEQHYMRDLPIHHSQKEIRTSAHHTDFEFYMRLTSDFKGYVMSKGEWLQIVSPYWLAKKIQQWRQAAIDTANANKN